MSNDWRVKHRVVIQQVLAGLLAGNKAAVLKGGTALMLFYGLERFSEDIDLNCLRGYNFIIDVGSFCSRHKYTYRVSKDTDSVKRVFINYGNESHPLKVEASYRQGWSPEEIRLINNVQVYTEASLLAQKILAYLGRDKIRDLWDIAFLFKRMESGLLAAHRTQLSEVLTHKGLDHVEWLINTQQDELIDVDSLLDMTLSMYQSLGLLGEMSELERVLKVNGLTKQPIEIYVKKILKFIPKAVYDETKSPEENALQYLPKVVQYLKQGD
jgi:predicted nucleotidyltransferase component of viral defense system